MARDMKKKKKQLDNYEILQGVLAGAQLGIWSIELEEGKPPRMYGNESMNVLVGVHGEISPEDYYNVWYDNIMDAYYPDVQKCVAQMEEGKRAEVEYPWNHPDWGTIYIRCGGVRDNRFKEGVCFRGYHQNITEQMQLRKENAKVQEELREIESTVRENQKIFSDLSNGYEFVVLIDLEKDVYKVLKDGRIKIKSSNSELKYNEDRQRIIRDIVYPEEQEDVFAFTDPVALKKRFTKDNRNLELNFRIRREDNKYYWLRMQYIISEIENHVVTKILCVTTDIHEEFEKNQKRRLHELAISAAVGQGFQLLNYIDVTSNSYEFLKHDIDLYGKSNILQTYDEMISNVEKNIYPEDRQKFADRYRRNNIKRAFEQGKKVQLLEYRQLMNDGKYHWVSTMLMKVDNPISEGIIAIFMLRNIDEVKRNEENSKQLMEDMLRRAESASAAKTDFLSKMSHDIRTPMNAIVGMTMLAEANLGNEKKVKECLSKINISSKHLLSLINEVLDMNKIESGAICLQEDEMCLTTLITDFLNIIRPLSEERKQKLILNMENILHEYYIGDVARLEQVFTNIASNSVKYTQNGGIVRIQITEKKSEMKGYALLEFVFEDNGIGMKEEFLEHIFESFTRAEDSRVSKVQGTGLGMAIASNIVKMMGGDIRVESVYGKGSRFTVNLPLKLQENLEKRTYYSPSVEKNPTDVFNDYQALLTGKKVLLVEDNELNMEIAKEILQMSGLIVDVAENGQEAINKFIDSNIREYQMILMDIQMPIMNGYDATKEIRSLDREDAATIPIIAMTADAFTEDIHKAKKYGMNEHISKPIHVEHMMKVLGSFIEK